MIEYNEKIKLDVTNYKMYLDDKEIPTSFVYSLSSAYEILCTANYIMDMNPSLSEEECFRLGAKVRHCMEKYDYTEFEAISELVDEYLKDKENDDEE